MLSRPSQGLKWVRMHGNVVSRHTAARRIFLTSIWYTFGKVIGKGVQRYKFRQAVRVATQYAPAPLLSPWAPKRLVRRRADAA